MKHGGVSVISEDRRQLSLERNALNIKSVADIKVSYQDTKGLVLERNPVNICNVIKPTQIPVPYKDTKELIRGRDPVNENCGKVYRDPSLLQRPERAHIREKPCEYKKGRKPLLRSHNLLKTHDSAH